VTASQAPVDPQVDARAQAAIDEWKRRLIDLTKRNRALNFRHFRGSTVAIVDELPAEVFRQLFLHERSMVLVPRPDDEPSTSPMAPTDPLAALLNIEAEEIDAKDFVPYRPEGLDPKHTDDRLQTNLSRVELDKVLRNLQQMAQTSLDEQGVNTLFLSLGMLRYRDVDDSNRELLAPIILLPVKLNRGSVREPFALSVGDDEPATNPALVEMLRHEYGIVMPELPSADQIADDFDLQTVLGEIQARVASHADWRVTNDIRLSIVSFQKFVMFKDLQTNAGAVTGHRLIRSLVSRTGAGMTGLPQEIQDLRLDDEFAPETTAQVVDADSSQLRVMVACQRGADLVVEGPPGTGKSQTITNLIAQALADGQRVLFVAEKMAALEVVRDRLAAVGLGEFCLELHSSKASKREVAKQIAKALDSSIERTKPTGRADQLPPVRRTLNEYVQATHTPRGALKMTPFEAFGHFGSVLGAPTVDYDGPVDDMSRDLLAATERALSDVAVHATAIGDVTAHPFRDALKTLYLRPDLDEIRARGNAVVALAATARQAALESRAVLPLSSIQTFAEAETAREVASVVAASPGAPAAVLQSSAWNQPPASAVALIEAGTAYAGLLAAASKRFSRDVLAVDHASDVTFVEQKRGGAFGFLAMLNGRYRAIRRRWLLWRLDGFQGSMLEQAAALRDVDSARALRKQLQEAQRTSSDLFGELWRGERSDWTALRAYMEWVVQFRAACVKHGLPDAVAEVAARRQADMSCIRALADVVERLRESVTALIRAVGWPDGYFDQATFGVIEERAGGIAASTDTGPAWAAFEAARSAAIETPGRMPLAAAVSGDLGFADLVGAFRKALLERWLRNVVTERPALARFNALQHEQRVAEFQRLDRLVLTENRERLIGARRELLQSRLRDEDLQRGLNVIRREVAKQRAHLPVRKLLQVAGDAVRAIKPCFLMSPISVAQLIDGSAPQFDLVVFDEASQMPPEDAVGSIVRGNQLVVVGDPKQLPPTNFFALMTGQSSQVATDEDGLPIVEDSESILEQMMGAGIPTSRLKWHYRSAHESLIAFSNAAWYDNELRTFPCVDSAACEGLRFVHVADGVYEGQGKNTIEARRVANEVIAFAREQLAREARGERPRSLGVGTFNMRQQLAILDELETRRRAALDVEPFFSRQRQEPFFVKNLENIQGDERDVILISVTYARAADGRMRYSLGPLNAENGWRRMNVLITRARTQVRVFSSIRGDEIDVTQTTARGAKLLRDYLLFVERGKLPDSVSVGTVTESPFEQDVFQELSRRGLDLVPQVGVCGYRIDLGVRDPEAPGRFLLGLECDGASYHSSETARDRDRLRQEVLEARGWRIVRVWSTDWFKDREGQIIRILEAAREQRNRPRTAVAAPPEPIAESAVELPEVRQVAIPDGYRRPAVLPYGRAAVDGRYSGRDILEAPSQQIGAMVLEVLATEGPIHIDELGRRVAAGWSTRLGSRIRDRIVRQVGRLCDHGDVELRGEFVWMPGSVVRVRSRDGASVVAATIPPEEYAEAVRMVLRAASALPLDDLVTEVRTLLGFARAGSELRAAIERTTELMQVREELGEVSGGYTLRPS
jgi:very-short-patch-repair endonuclease